MLIAQAVFLLQRGQTDATECPTHAGGENRHGTRLLATTAGIP